MIEELSNCKKVVGAKQCNKALSEKKALRVYVARDAQEAVTAQAVALCKEDAVEMIWVDTMRELGKACHIDVHAALVAVLK